MRCWLSARSSVFHLSQVLWTAEGTRASQSLLATQVCCDKIFTLNTVGEYHPKTSYTRAILDRNILFVKWCSNEVMLVVRCSVSDSMFQLIPSSLVNSLTTGSSLLVPCSIKCAGKWLRALGCIDFHFLRKNLPLSKSSCTSFWSWMASKTELVPVILNPSST